MCAVVVTDKNYSTKLPLPQHTGKMEKSDSECTVVAFVVPRHSSVPPEWGEGLMQELVHSQPGFCVPDAIVPVHYLPFNHHGQSVSLI